MAQLFVQDGDIYNCMNLPKTIENYQSLLKAKPNSILNLQKAQRQSKICPSGKISPNLVTLVAMSIMILSFLWRIVFISNWIADDLHWVYDTNLVMLYR